MPALAKLGHVAFRTPDLEESLWFFADLMNLQVVERTEDTAYLCGFRDHEHHTLSLTEGAAGGVDHIGWRTADPESLEAYADRLAELGIAYDRVDGSHEAGVGEALRFEVPGGHPWELYWEVDKPKPEGDKRSMIPTRRYNTDQANRVFPQRIDHVHVQDPNAPDHSTFLQDEFDFGLNEVFKDHEGELWGWWMAVTALPHDIGLHRIEEPDPRFHHISYHVDHLQDLWDAADMLREHRVELDAGPGRHAITNANYLYVRDPASGIRLELFAGPGYLNFEPDWETVEWQEEIGTTSNHQWFGDQYSADGVPYVNGT